MLQREYSQCGDDRVVKVAGLRSAGCKSAWVRPPLPALFFLCFLIKKRKKNINNL